MSVFLIHASQMPRVKMVLIYILASVRKDLLVMAMELPVATGNLITDNL